MGWTSNRDIYFLIERLAVVDHRPRLLVHHGRAPGKPDYHVLIRGRGIKRGRQSRLTDFMVSPGRSPYKDAFSTDFTARVHSLVAAPNQRAGIGDRAGVELITILRKLRREVSNYFQAVG